MKRQHLRPLFALCLVSVLTSSLLAAKPPINLSETLWQFDATFAANIKKMDKTKLTGPTDLVFGPSAASVLGADEFLLTDPEGDTLTGTFLAGSKKTVLSLTPASLTTYLTAKILAGANTAGLIVTVNTINSTSIKAVAKPKSTQVGLAITVILKVKATADLTVDGQSRTVKLTVTLKGKGEIPLTATDLPPTVSGSQWEIPVRVKSGLIDTNTEDLLELYFGPNVDEGLAANEYKVINLNLDEFTGTYTVTKNSQVTFTLNQNQFEQLIVELTEANLAGGGATVRTINITKSAAFAKIKPTLAIALRVKINFNGIVELDGERFSRSGNLSIAGKGSPLIDQPDILNLSPRLR